MLEENQELKEEVHWLNDVITHNISEIMKQMDALREKEEQHNLLQSEQIDSLISEHDEDITSVRAQHAVDIASVRAEHDEDITSVRTEHTEDITSIRTDMDNIKNDLVLDPVGNLHLKLQIAFTTKIYSSPHTYLLQN